MASLVIVSGQQAGRHFKLTKRTLTAGRDPARDIQITDGKVSRKHFQVRYEIDHYVIVELRSLNGVSVNGGRIVGEQRLHDGDQIHVGDTLLEFYEQDVPDRTNALNLPRKMERTYREDRTMAD